MSDHAQTAEAAAKAKGLVVVLPGHCDLFVDIDCPEDLAQFERNIKIVETVEAPVPLSVVRRPSPSGRPHHLHIVVRLGRPVRDAFERILLQTLLGSDSLHEALSWQGAHRGDTNPTIFFEKPEAMADALVDPVTSPA